RWADDTSRGRKHKLTVNHAARSDDKADPLVRWKTVALDVDAVSAAGHVAIVIEAGVLRARTGAQNEPAVVDVQDLFDLTGNVGNESVRRRLPDRDDLRGSQHSVEVARPAAGTCLLATTPQGDLRDGDPDQDEKHGDFDVIGIIDGE